MSFSIEHARSIIASLQIAPIPNFISQAKAKQLLNEVHEKADNYPEFTENLDERVTFLAYRMLSAGCSLVEQNLGEEGHPLLHKAGDLLESTHRTSATTNNTSSFHSLIGAMSFYACGHYSRAFILIRQSEFLTPIARLVASFLRKDFQSTIKLLNSVLLGTQVSQNYDLDSPDSKSLEITISRSISFLLEHIHSGEPDLLKQADNALNDALIISEAEASPSYWWIARLLRLMIYDYSEGSLWTCLSKHFEPQSLPAIRSYVSLLATSNPPVIEIWRSQKASLQLALENSTGGVVNLRTSAGKTRVAELAILKTLTNDNKCKVLYLAPYRSLAFELERTFGKFLGALGYSISHLYGGSRFSGIDRDMVAEANLLIATPEKTKAMLRAAPELFNNLRLIIIDEGHLLGGNKRNVRNELFLENLRLLAQNNNSRILLLSAVLPNAKELATWIGGNENALAQSNWKPSDERFGILKWTKKGVQIEWRSESRCFNPDFVDFKEVQEPNKPNTRRFPKSKTEAVAATAVRLAEIGPVLIFAAQAQWVHSMARAVMLAFQERTVEHTWPETQWKAFEAVCVEELGPDSIELEAARLGVICHSNRLPPQVRIAVENLMASGAPRVIVATSTLGQGVNIGVSSVIVAQTLIGQNLRISKRDFWNICGRAGRAFIDGEGKILFAIDGTKEPWQIKNDQELANEYLDINNIDKVESGLLQVVGILKNIAEQSMIAFEVFLELVANSDFSPLTQQQSIIEELFNLLDDQLLAMHVLHKGVELTGDQVDWVETAFHQSLASIQAHITDAETSNDAILLLKARTRAILHDIRAPQMRKAIISSGLPLSAGKHVYRDLDLFRKFVDDYLESEKSISGLQTLVSKVENWARESSLSIFESIPSSEALDVIRPLWLEGVALVKIQDSIEEDALTICTRFYAYELTWLLHAIAQNFDAEEETNRREALALASILLEMGLPNEAASKVFLAGIRSRAAAVELSVYVANPSASPRAIRNAILKNSNYEALLAVCSLQASTWLELLANSDSAPSIELPSFPIFSLEAPAGVSVLHCRRLENEEIFLCSTDGRFMHPVGTTDDFPFLKIVNDPRYFFTRTYENIWEFGCRDPRIQPKA